MRFVLIATLILMTFPTYAKLSAHDTCTFNGIDYDAAIEFMLTLQAALNDDKPAAAANLANYPLKVNSVTSDHQTYTYRLKNKREFIQAFPDLFSSSMREKILKDNKVFCNYQGAMLGDGAIWFNTITGKGKIFLINHS